ncbi:MAG: alpha/beta fold hydrolase [Actinomycetota bacterium]|nr:alpha/beta fold hydrolase [Actinomycetota bacterium]
MSVKSMVEIGERLREIPFVPRRPRLLALADAYSPDFTRISTDILGAMPDGTRPYPENFEKVVFPSLDDTPLVGILGLHRDGRRRPGVVFCHGFHGSKNKNYIMEAALKAFSEWDYNVLALDLRDFGESRDLSHAPSTGGWKEGQDILGACRFLGGMEEVTSVGAVGYSLGASAVLNAAYQNDLYSYITGGIIAWSGFASMEAIVSRFSRRPPVNDPFFPYYAAFIFLTEIRRLEMLRRGKEEIVATLGDRPFSPDFRRYVREVVAPHYGKSEEAIYALSSPRNFVDRIEHPVLIVHAEDDPVCPVEEMEELRRAGRGNPNLDIWVLPTGSHCAFMGFDEDWYWAVMRGFLDYWAERESQGFEKGR